MKRARRHFFANPRTFERRALTTPQREAHSTKRQYMVKGECTEKKTREEVGNSMIRGEVGGTSGEKGTAASFYGAIDNFNRRFLPSETLNPIY